MAIKGKLIQFRQGRHTVHEKHYIIAVDGIENKSDTTKVVGKSVSWKSSAGKIIKGKIAASHGGKGRVRAIFEKGLPGQAMTEEVTIE
jgi:large subunit ribosomal protein L35Ae